jgi:hypothetical protein
MGLPVSGSRICRWFKRYERFPATTTMFNVSGFEIFLMRKPAVRN